MDNKIAVGQRIMAGLPGTEIDDGFRTLVRECKIGNVILFRRNIESREQLKALCAALRELILSETGYEPLIAIDQEGGAVTRLSTDMINTPGGMALAAAGGDAPYRAGLITASELRSVGIDFNLAPVLDVNSNPANPVIGVRSFGDEPEKAAGRALGFMRGTLDGGVMACGKHFPGHGDTSVDSHLGLPRVEKSREELEKCELLPFRRAVEAGIPAIMTSHVLFPALEPEELPATMSRRILTWLLRGELGFGGLIISDCMEMQAIGRFYGSVNGVEGAIRAGADIVCISHTASVAREAAERLLSLLEGGELDAGEFKAAVERALSAKHGLAAAGGRVQGPADTAEARELLERSFTLVRGPMRALGGAPLFTGGPASRSTQASSRTGGEPVFAEYMAGRLGGSALITADEPDEDEIRAAVKAAENCSCIVLATCNAHLKPRQLALMKALGETGKPMAVCAMRDPYDLSELPSGAAGVAVWEYTAQSLEALVPFLSGEQEFVGFLPLAKL